MLVGFGLALLPELPAGPTGLLWWVSLFCLGCAALLLWATEAEGRVGMPFDDDQNVTRGGRVAVGWLIVAGVLGLATVLRFGWHLLGFTAIFGAVGFVLYLLANQKDTAADRRSTTQVLALARVLFVAGWVSVGLIIISYAASGRRGNPTSIPALVASPGWLVGLPLAAVVLLICFLRFDQTSWSPHPYYKSRLAGTFSIRRIVERNVGGDRGDVQVLPYDEYSYLDAWAAPVPPVNRPQLLVCATANAEDRSIPPAGTRAVPFVFAHDFVGSPELGWWRTADFQRCLGSKLASDGTLQAAMAISGAAVASGLGVKGRIPSVGTALALLNARLGVWLPNPNARHADTDWPDAGRKGSRNRRRRPSWLWREVAGFLPGTKRFIYVSDGGHLDNLGLLELLRRRTRVILIADASADQVLTTRALDGVCELAAEHFGTAIKRETSNPLRTPATEGLPERGAALRGVSEGCVEVMTIDYPALSATEPALQGLLVVAKARFSRSLLTSPLGTELDRARVYEKIAQSPQPRWWPWSMRTLPTTLTANQWLTNDQFTGYVALGRAVGDQAVERLTSMSGKERAQLSEQEAVP
jgi:hypothetical protein